MISTFFKQHYNKDDVTYDSVIEASRCEKIPNVPPLRPAVHMKQLKCFNYIGSFTNIRSIMPKQDELSAFIGDKNSSIVILTESWLKL